MDVSGCASSCPTVCHNVTISNWVLSYRDVTSLFLRKLLFLDVACNSRDLSFYQSTSSELLPLWNMLAEWWTSYRRGDGLSLWQNTRLLWQALCHSYSDCLLISYTCCVVWLLAETMFFPSTCCEFAVVWSCCSFWPFRVVNTANHLFMNVCFGFTVCVH